MPSVRAHTRLKRDPRFRKKTCEFCGRQISFAFGNFRIHYKNCFEKAEREHKAKLEKAKGK